MNNIKFANFMALWNLNDVTLINEREYSTIFAGMYTLTVLVKDGFAGLEELKREVESDFIEKIKREIKRTLKRQREQGL